MEGGNKWSTLWLGVVTRNIFVAYIYDMLDDVSKLIRCKDCEVSGNRGAVGCNMQI